MNTIEAMKGKEQMIIDHYNLPPITYKRHFSGACPLCGKKHKFRLDFYNGSLGYIFLSVRLQAGYSRILLQK